MLRNANADDHLHALRDLSIYAELVWERCSNEKTLSRVKVAIKECIENNKINIKNINALRNRERKLLEINASRSNIENRFIELKDRFLELTKKDGDSHKTKQSANIKIVADSKEVNSCSFIEPANDNHWLPRALWTSLVVNPFDLDIYDELQALKEVLRQLNIATHSIISKVHKFRSAETSSEPREEYRRLILDFVFILRERIDFARKIENIDSKIKQELDVNRSLLSRNALYEAKVQRATSLHSIEPKVTEEVFSKSHSSNSLRSTPSPRSLTNSPRSTSSNSPRRSSPRAAFCYFTQSDNKTENPEHLLAKNDERQLGNTSVSK